MLSRIFAARLTLGLALALSLGLAACTSVTTEVDALSAIPADLTPTNAHVVPGPGMDAGSLGWQQGAEVLAGVLLGKGVTPVAARSGARLVTRFGYRIDDGQTVTSQYMVPERGIIGYQVVNRPGPNGGQIAERVPVWGTIGYDYRTRIDTIYTAEVTISMTDSRSGKQVFEGRGVYRGGCSSFAPLAAPMIGAVLSKFPAGRQGPVTIKTENGC
ncbi:DUF4136 domain-containing protein [Pseudooceanicola algae]|uniref:DUF4136 domain-containing protein n=1 Tax=Pseudooceanicola algae TaxID=1537215 RepID=A0A418SII7_9RHOB|nr:hypothetical protein [Pseudooceanicola algae]QPM92147.1 hypothetical protein PSAL_034100 [Pseudooceanicola algae]